MGAVGERGKMKGAWVLVDQRSTPIAVHVKLHLKNLCLCGWQCETIAVKLIGEKASITAAVNINRIITLM